MSKSARSCAVANVDAAKKQTARMIADAERQIPANSSCSARLMTARTAFESAGQIDDSLERRNEYVRASFQAGQALTCAVVTGIIKPERGKKKRTIKVKTDSASALPANTAAPKATKKRSNKRG